ncbi:hypothetical protein UB33_20065 [Photobacterium angustum]|uniref:FUSC family protein n=1 Tax=Photobacterium angustum TaxID=661 RepID=UPI0005DD673A|nr:FUSC family protein [Photobacterium angustum]KJG04255.1 hypothetical protein UB33_20065 [Photobacterium angustum]PSV87855.1 FUSC family protein [Photobacterium angustum]PSW76478.1 FUSC family protein [Photobacterium angustum]
MKMTWGYNQWHIKQTLSAWCDVPTLVCMTVAIFPCFIVACITGDHRYLQLGLVSGALFCVQNSLGLSGLLETCLHWLAIILGFTVLYWVQSSPLLFALFSALLGAICASFSYWDKNLKSLGNWILIPALYLSCELYDRVNPHAFTLAYIKLLEQLPVTLIGPILVLVCLNMAKIPKDRTYALIGRDHPYIVKKQPAVIYSVLSIFFAIFMTAVFVKYFAIKQGQWVIWSSVSVITGELSSMHKKFKHRGRGAVLGLSLGGGVVYLSSFIGSVTLLNSFAAFLIPLTLVIKPYPVAFTLRCMLIAIAAGSMIHTESIAMVRMFDVVLGGVIGVISVYVVTYVISPLLKIKREKEED